MRLIQCIFLMRALFFGPLPFSADTVLRDYGAQLRLELQGSGRKDFLSSGQEWYVQMKRKHRCW